MAQEFISYVQVENRTFAYLLKDGSLEIKSSYSAYDKGEGQFSARIVLKPGGVQTLFEWLTRVAELRNETAAGGTTEACPPDRHTYYTAFLTYQHCPYCGERLLR